MLLEKQADGRIEVLEIATGAASEVTLLPAYQQLITGYSKYRSHITDSLQA
jgi:hypothetical protein